MIKLLFVVVVVWFIIFSVEFNRNIVMFARFVSVEVTFMIIFFLDNSELFVSVGRANVISGAIESTKKVTEEEFILFDVSLA